MLWQAEEMTLVWLSQALRLGGLHLWVTLIFAHVASTWYQAHKVSQQS